jgi:hypothetical protein
MLHTLSPFSLNDVSFSRSNLKTLSKYFDFDFLSASLEEKEQFFRNLQVLSRQDLSLAHNIQHSQTAQIIVSQSACQAARDYVLTKPFGELIGCYSIFKRSDKITLENNILNGQKKWFSNIDDADYGVMQVNSDGKKLMVYFNLHELEHKIDHSSFTPIGMEVARAGALTIENQPIADDQILGIAGTQQFFQQSSFASYCFLTNHYGITKQLFLDIKQYAERFDCGAELEIKKLEIDVCALEMLWEDNLVTLKETALTNEFWNRRNAQYAFSKKTLIKVIQLVLELGVSYYTDAKSELSQRFRDAITYCSHMHPLYRFGQEFNMIDLNK